MTVHNYDEIEQQIKFRLNEISIHERELRKLYDQCRVSVSVTEKRYFKLQMLADSIDTDIETILYIALEDYERKVEKFDATQSYKTLKI